MGYFWYPKGSSVRWRLLAAACLKLTSIQRWLSQQPFRRPSIPGILNRGLNSYKVVARASGKFSLKLLTDSLLWPFYYAMDTRNNPICDSRRSPTLLDTNILRLYTGRVVLKIYSVHVTAFVWISGLNGKIIFAGLFFSCPLSQA